MSKVDKLYNILRAIITIYFLLISALFINKMVEDSGSNYSHENTSGVCK